MPEGTMQRKCEERNLRSSKKKNSTTVSIDDRGLANKQTNSSVATPTGGRRVGPRGTVVQHNSTNPSCHAWIASSAMQSGVFSSLHSPTLKSQRQKESIAACVSPIKRIVIACRKNHETSQVESNNSTGLKADGWMTRSKANDENNSCFFLTAQREKKYTIRLVQLTMYMLCFFWSATWRFWLRTILLSAKEKYSERNANSRSCKRGTL